MTGKSMPTGQCKLYSPFFFFFISGLDTLDSLGQGGGLVKWGEGSGSRDGKMTRSIMDSNQLLIILVV